MGQHCAPALHANLNAVLECRCTKKSIDMTRLSLLIPLLGLVLATPGCRFIDDDDLDFNPSLDDTVPNQVQDFIDTNYNGLAIEGSRREELCDSLPVYEIELENGPGPDIDLYFDLNWNFLFEATEVPNSALPSEVLASLQAQFPGYVLEPGFSERHDFPDDSVQYLVSLENDDEDDLEVVLKEDGTIVCEEED